MISDVEPDLWCHIAEEDHPVIRESLIFRMQMLQVEHFEQAPDNFWWEGGDDRR
jgi:hypothetical protein